MTSAPKFEGRKILVVEDEPDNYDLLEILLNRMGISITHAWDGGEAMRLFELDSGIELVLMDFKLPDIPRTGSYKDDAGKKTRPSSGCDHSLCYAW